ncbi:class I SAM-dependent methyltransferase [Tenacibaculum maritimum]|uniref:class I SAM-dependent methyltransferase n=1 Tax=Tenacibaculum maritimum TaxID=107401 RepID=UPI0012E627A8|nr:methyltransferase [Tenacibaculum maritimum]CAA0214997.1 putative rRNA (Guanine-N(2)-)-methyltransferase [Tenacibaculum maritimum]
MEASLNIESATYHLERYPHTNDKNLKAWSNAELLALDYYMAHPSNTIHLFNDRFGIWNCTLHSSNPITIWTHASQKKAISLNLKRNNLPTANTILKTPLTSLNKVETALIKVPKSLELFELFLQQIHSASNENTTVICCFMTKYFTPSLLKIAEFYFNDIQQTKAWKKARLLLLKKPKSNLKSNPSINTIPWKNKELKQYYGVFSSGKIDIGTQFLLENLALRPLELKIADLASGNGVIAHEIIQKKPTAKVTLIDDFNLAIASSQLNLKNKNTIFLCEENLDNLSHKNFDLVVSNPPFHFEYENNIEITLNLFKGVFNCLSSKGRFVLVANLHLNYKTHLDKLFTTVNSICSNKKFVIYECYK